MEIIYYPPPDSWKDLLRRPVIEAASLEKQVKKIMDKVRRKGDLAVRSFTRQLDGVKLKKIPVTAAEWKAARQGLDPALKEAILQAAANIRRFHENQLGDSGIIETMPGVQCWRKSIGIEKVGLYIPGGSAPLFSTVLMLGIPARLAGCREIILCSPPGKEGSLHPAILFAAETVGIHQVFKVGGVQAVAAMAYGTETIPQVFKIFGPGNQYVTCAKQLLQKEGIAIDMPAGPSEVAVYADETSDPEYVAADLLSQAEHGPDSQVLLLLKGESRLTPIREALERQLGDLPRRDLASRALANSKIILVEDDRLAMDLLNEYAPEHLILCCAGAENLAEQVINAGSVFIGPYSPESVGDYASGTNHTLPTNGYAKAYSGVSVDSFVRKITFQKLSREGLSLIGPTVISLAMAEGLQAHGHAVAVRLPA